MDTKTIGSYRLLQKLGEGAAGEVHLATPMLDMPFAKSGEPVALKIYKKEILKQHKQLERIEREFTIGSTLVHPNLVRILDSKLRDSRLPPYLVMEYVDGMPLDQFVEMFHPFPGPLLLKIVDQLIDAVECLHDQDIIHRDIKPQNIMISMGLDAKVMDLGVVHVTKSSPLTPEGKFVGTIRNSSPEFLYGGDYDHTTDLYSLGTVLYMLLYGHQVYSEENQFARLIELVKKEEPSYDLCVQNRDQVSSSLLDISRSLLSKNPKERPASCGELRERIKNIRDLVVKHQDEKPLHGYIATALTGLSPDARDAIAFASTKISQLAKEYNLYIYQPRRATDPLLHSDVDPAAVYLKDRSRVINADVILVLANHPSFGVGQELEIAATYGKPTFILARAGTKISRMVTGSFTNLIGDIIYYETPEDLEKKLRKSFSLHLERIRRDGPVAIPRDVHRIGNRIANLRVKLGYSSHEEFAVVIGVSARTVQAIEDGQYDNIGLSLLSRICDALRCHISDLFGALASQVIPMTPIDSNIMTLERVAGRLNWGANDYFLMRNDYNKQLAASKENPTISEAQWQDKHHALERRKLAAQSDDGKIASHEPGKQVQEDLMLIDQTKKENE